MGAVKEASPKVGVAPACRALGLPRATFYRRSRPQEPLSSRAPRPRPPRALSESERCSVVAVLHSERFVDQAPPQIYASLLEEETYLCSVRTMYRILEAAGEVRERRNQLRHPNYTKPELLATAPNQLWSWDITKLLGPVKWTYYYLYVLLDVFSRYVVGWLLAHRESQALATRLIRESCEKEGILPGQLTVHSDRGPAMISQPVAHLLADLGVTKSHSRPHVSNDNPFSEAQFKTFKYRPEIPERFGSYEHAHEVCTDLFPWYNHEHHHSGLAYLTPAAVHHGRAGGILATRQAALDAAFAAHPERFVHRPPRTSRPPEAVWINPPSPALVAQ